ncbi:chaperonin 10-like protein [Apodospora peruviana]|uniref:Chaperonin 10-like protein n=1 Tax=Apodospora peruviana TaxID=516989 RepID=A0AAE0HUF1_9PEZI|nr:chaperonin 10-like protein [Apodospora peruviana]
MPSSPSPDLTKGFTSEAYVALSPTTPITLQSITYGPIAAGEIVLSTAAVSVCASDLKAAAGKFHGCSPPMILGHECAGTILGVGVSVTSQHLKPGDKVVLSYDSCRSCVECLAGASAYCHDLVKLNLSGLRQGVDGSRATAFCTAASGEPIKGHFFGQSSMGRTIVARANCVAVKLPDDTTPDQMRVFASLGCGIQTGAGAILNVARPEPNSSICIFGAGSVGLAACLAANLTSPKSLVVVDNSAAKLGMLPDCVRAAVTDLVDSSVLMEEQLVERLKGLTSSDGGLGGFDYVLDCVGRGELAKLGHRVLRPRGMLIAVGGSPDMALQVTLSQHLTKGVMFRGTHQGDSVPSISIPLMIDLWRQGKFPFDKLLSFYEFDALDKAMEDLKQGKVIKPVLVNNQWHDGAAQED